ncbi:unnamed protein product, partial [Ectocarpus sp. 12 AP-2014]
SVGGDHLDYARALSNRAKVLEAQGKHAEAEPLYKQSHAIRKKSLVQEDSDGAEAEVLTNRAFLLKEQGKYEEAERLYVRVQELLRNYDNFGEEHPQYIS